MAAKARWRILANAIHQSKQKEDEEKKGELEKVSVKRFGAFGLFSTSVSSNVNVQTDSISVNSSNWVMKDFKIITSFFSDGSDLPPDLTVRLKEIVPAKVSLQEMIGFNNTGNVCVWPSEEILGFYCIENRSIFREAHVCELGAGMTALAGFLLAAASPLKSLLLTDGNELSVQNIVECVSTADQLSPFATSLSRVSAAVLRWTTEELHEWQHRYDYVICADSLFFEDAHDALIKTLDNLLNATGKGIFFAPKRSGSFDRFVVRAQEIFETKVTENYHPHVWKLHREALSSNVLYDANIHYPWLLELQKK